jgi:nucleoside-triphosphatase
MPRNTDIAPSTGRRAHFLITGLPGVGKTTLVRGLATRLAAYNPAGFYTEEIRDAQGKREGFRIVTLCGRRLVLSHIDFRARSRVGRYGVDVAGFERLLTELDLGRARSRVFIIDEIGKMECLSSLFVKEVTALLNGPATVVATIALKAGGFIRQVKERPDCRLITVARENRDRLLGELASELEEKLRGHRT